MCALLVGKGSKHASHNWTESKREAADNRKDGPTLGALFERHAVGENGPGQGAEAGRGHALECSSEEQHRVRVRRRARAERAADDHEQDGGRHGRVPAKDVGDLRPKRDKGGRGEVEGGDDPVLLGDFVKVLGDPEEGTRDAIATRQ